MTNLYKISLSQNHHIEEREVTQTLELIEAPEAEIRGELVASSGPFEVQVAGRRVFVHKVVARDSQGTREVSFFPELASPESDVVLGLVDGQVAGEIDFRQRRLIIRG